MIANGLISAAGTTVLTVPTGRNYAVVNIAVCNYTDSETTVDVHVVPAAATPSDATTVIKARQMGAHDSLFLSSEKFLLGPGDRIFFVAGDDSALSAMVSYIAI